VVFNEPGRRGRTVGADLVAGFADLCPVDVFGMRTKAYVQSLQPGQDRITAYEDLFSQNQMHTELARRRVYLHPMRWTSLGLSLVEAMQLAMPIVALAATDAVTAVSPQAGVVSTDLEVLRSGVRTFLHEPEAARRAGVAARSAALKRYGLIRFLSDWDRLLDSMRETG
jgi:glycosyltransferase involved in cell wall biosynthesis